MQVEIQALKAQLSTLKSSFKQAEIDRSKQSDCLNSLISRAELEAALSLVVRQ